MKTKIGMQLELYGTLMTIYGINNKSKTLHCIDSEGNKYNVSFRQIIGSVYSVGYSPKATVYANIL